MKSPFNKNPKYIKSFAPVFDDQSKVLILGSMPGEESLKQNQYYAHKRNKFWSYLGEILKIEMNISYRSKIKLLLENRIALWDIISHCKREGSLDQNIKSKTVVANEIDKLIAECPKIKAIFFNGKAAQKYFNSLQKKRVFAIREVELVTLPSTSPANARTSKEEQLKLWKSILDYL